MRLLATFVIVMAILGCGSKSEPPRQQHDSGQSRKPMNTTSNSEPDGLQISNFDGQSLQQLQNSLFNPEIFLDPIKSKTDSFFEAIDIYQDRLLSQLRSGAVNQEVISLHLSQLFGDCQKSSAIELEVCSGFSAFRKSPNTAPVLIFLASREQDLKRRYQIIMAAFELSNRSYNVELLDLYLDRSSDYAQLISKNRPLLLRHYKYLNLIARTYPKERVERIPARIISSFNLLEINEQHPLAPARKELLRKFGSRILYHDQQPSPELKQMLKQRFERAGTIISLTKGWSTKTDDLTAQVANHAAKHMLDFNLNTIEQNEYLFLIDGLYLNEVDIETADLFWKASKNDSAALVALLIKYSKIRFLETILKSNLAIKEIFFEKQKTSRIEAIESDVERETERIRTGLWNQHLIQQRILREFYQRNIRDQIDTKLQIETDQHFFSINSNLNVLAVNPHMWVMAKQLQDLKSNFSYVVRFGGVKDNENFRTHHVFFRDMFEMSPYPWFDLGGGQSIIDRQQSLLSFYNVFRLGLLDLYGISAEDFLEDIAKYYVVNTRDLLQKSLRNLQTLTKNGLNLNSFMGTCARVAERYCKDESVGDKKIFRNKGYLRICDHQEVLKPFKAFSQNPFTMRLNQLEEFSFTGSPVGLERSGSESNVTPTNTILKRGTSFYYFPDFEFSNRRNLDELIEVTREDSRERIAFMSFIAKTLQAEFPQDASILKGIAKLRAELESLNHLNEEIWSLTFNWENRIGLCTPLLIKAEYDRQFQIVENEANYLRLVHQDMKKLRIAKANSQVSPAQFEQLKADLNEKYRPENIELFKSIDKLKETYPASKYGFDDRYYQFNPALFTLRAAAFISESEPTFNIILPTEATSLGISQAEVRKPVEWIEDEDQFIKEVLSKIPAPGPVRWFHFSTQILDLNLVRSRFLIRSAKLGKIEIDKVLWQKYGGQEFALFDTCESSNAEKICLKLNYDDLVDDLRSQAQLMQISEEDREWLPWLNREGRITVNTQTSGLYCILKQDKTKFDQCDRRLDHFDFHLERMSESTAMDPVPGDQEVDAFNVFIPRQDFILVAQDYQRRCDDNSRILFGEKFKPLTYMDELMRRRVREEFETRREFKSAILRRYKYDKEHNQILPIEFDLFRPINERPQYATISVIEDIETREANFHRDTDSYFLETRACGQLKTSK